MRKRFHETPAPSGSPWGTVQVARQVGHGVWRVTTAGHGGFHVSAERLKACPGLSYFGEPDGVGGGWYEEDCAWAPLALAYPELWPGTFQVASETLRRYWPLPSGSQ